MDRLTDKDTNKVCFDTWELCGLDYVCKRDCHKPTPCKIPKIIRRLADLEDKLENGQLLELPTIISFPDTHPSLGKITAYQVIWLSELLGIRHEKYTTREQAEARLKELKEKL